MAAIRPTKEMLEGVEHSHAQAAMLSEGSAVGAYDHVPVASAAGVYTFDTASEVFMLHSAKVRRRFHLFGAMHVTMACM